MDAPRRMGISELAEMAGRVHTVIVNYNDTDYVFPWKELAEKDMPAVEKLPKDATDDEKLQAMDRAIDAAAFRMIAAGMKAEDGVEVTYDTWLKIPARLRRMITMKVLDVRAELHNDFLQ